MQISRRRVPEVSPIPPLNLTLDSTLVRNSSDIATFSGACTAGLLVEVRGGDPEEQGSTTCVNGRFEFLTEQRTLDGTFVYDFRQVDQALGAEVQATGRWLRLTEINVELANERIVSNADRVTFRGSCTEAAGSVEVTFSDVQLSVSCVGSAFEFETPPRAIGTFDFVFRQFNLDGVASFAIGTWIKNSSTAAISLDQDFLANGADSARFSGDCTQGLDAVSVTLGTLDLGSQPCVDGRFEFVARDSTDGLRRYAFEQSGDVVEGQWSREANPTELPKTGVSPRSEFGDSIATNGELIVVGAPSDDTNGSDAGAAFVYRYAAGSWSTPVRLEPSEARPGEKFGESSAMNERLIFVGADFSPPRVCLFDATQPDFPEVACVDGPNASRFGNRIDADASTLVVGAQGESYDGFADGGAVYVYDISGLGPDAGLRLSASPPHDQSRLGARIAVAGSWLVASQRAEDELMPAGRTRTQLFRRTDPSWTPVGESNPDFWNVVAVARVGVLALSDRYLVVIPVGSSSATVLRLNGDTWVFDASIPNPGGGAISSADLAEDSLVIVDSAALGGRGEAFVYRRTGVAWELAAQRAGVDSSTMLGADESALADGIVSVSNGQTQSVAVFRY
ncbi:MAG: FG-GAP repeat protein [Myxococcota bacterium]